MNHILFITSTNLAGNPRLVKELRLALQHGYQATVVQFKVGNWSDAMTNELKNEFSTATFIDLSALRRPFLPWLISSLLERIFRLLPVSFLRSYLLAIAVSKRSYLLMQALDKIAGPFNWVVAHNPSSFYPAWRFAKKKNAFLGIDVEDYHPGETKDSYLSAIMIKLMQTILPKAAYCSYAAPLIKKEVHSIVRIPDSNNQFVIINGFDKNDFVVSAVPVTSALKVVWFSQHIDFERGLEKIIPVINSLHPDVELHLIGNLRANFAKSCLQNVTGVTLHGIMNQKKLHKFLAGFDVGLAIEPGKDKNNQLAVSNKLITYLQAGLFPVATATDAQLDFLSTHHLDYQLLPDSEELILKVFLQIVASKQTIRNGSNSRFLAGQKFDWIKLYEPLNGFWNKLV